MLTIFVHNFYSQYLFTTLVHNSCSKTCSQLLFITFVQNFFHLHHFSQLLLINVVHIFCSQLLLTFWVQNLCSQLFHSFYSWFLFAIVSQRLKVMLKTFVWFFVTFVHNLFSHFWFKTFLNILFSHRLFYSSTYIKIFVLWNYCLQFTTFDAQFSWVSLSPTWSSNPPTAQPRLVLYRLRLKQIDL